jgi:hypothetical protein
MTGFLSRQRHRAWRLRLWFPHWAASTSLRAMAPSRVALSGVCAEHRVLFSHNLFFFCTLCQTSRCIIWAHRITSRVASCCAPFSRVDSRGYLRGRGIARIVTIDRRGA